MFTVVQDMGRAKCRIEGCFCLRQAILVHIAANIAALGRVAGVHVVGIQVVARDDDNMVRGAGCVAALIPVVKASNEVVYASDLPVIAEVNVLERTSFDSRGLLCGQAAAQVFPPVDHIVGASIIQDADGLATAGHNQRTRQRTAGQRHIGFLCFILQSLFGIVDFGVDLFNLIVHHLHGRNRARVNGHFDVGDIGNCHDTEQFNYEVAVLGVGRDFNAAVILHDKEQRFIAVGQLCVYTDLMQDIARFHITVRDLDFDALASIVAGAVACIFDAEDFKGLLFLLHIGEGCQRSFLRGAGAAHGLGDRHRCAGQGLRHHIRADGCKDRFVPTHVFMPPILTSICCLYAAMPAGAKVVAL